MKRWTSGCNYRMPPKYKGGPMRVYLRTDCLDWLLSFGADEHHFQGVVRSEPAKGAQKVANCAAVAGLRLTWDFQGKAWDAEFVSGTFQGTQKRLATQHITGEQWANLPSDVCKG